MIGLAFAIAMVYIGAEHKDDCPVEPMIPIFMISERLINLCFLVLVVVLVFHVPPCHP